ncbi:MAG: PilZ domain-containing protein [Desulfamplus sp.]|nr:PilZ domain-containing protein [Desulfamplus sp.]
MVKGYVDEKNQTVFICPHCGFEKRFDASPFKDKKKNITIKCKCGNSTLMEIEFRRQFRKKVELFGSCTIKKTQKRCDIIVKDLSFSGVGFELLHVYKRSMADIDVGDPIEVEFRLDDKKQELITKMCVVRLKLPNHIGAEFEDENFAKQLGFYLLS